MSVSQLINEIVSEWAYRVEDGMPNPNNPTHLKELGVVLSEMGLSHIKNDLVKSLLGEAEEGGFKNPALNKKINYKNTKGEDKEGIVGNLLRLPAEHPGRKAAERTLPPEGSEERDALNKDLGGEGQPTKPEEPKGKEGDKEGGAPKEDPIQKAAPMFDPKADPAMGARLAKEKEVQAQLAGGEDKPKEEPKKEEPQTFDPVPAQDVKEEIPQADPEVFGGQSDIPDGIEKEDLKQFNTNIQKVADKVKEAKAKGEKVDINLCDVTVPGTNLYCDDNLGIPRDQMPQFKGKPVPGSRAEKMPLNKDGEVDTEPVFREMLKEKGITTTQTEVPADQLKATQSELGGDKVVGMMGALEQNPEHPSITGPIYVSRDGYVIDGHHRWAAIVAYNAKYPEKQIPMKCEVIDKDIKEAIPMCNKFAEDMGIAAKKQGETTGKAGEEPKKVSSIKPESFTDKIKAKLSKWQESEKEFFSNGYYKAGSDARRSIGETIKDKAAGAWKAIKQGAKHEVEEFKTAGKGVGKFFKGEELDEHEKKALKGVAIKVATTALFGAAMGGLSYGAAGFAKHVAIEFVPHVVAETLLKGVGRAAVFADAGGEAETDANMQKFIEMIAKGLEDMEISQEQMEDMINSYDEKKEKGETEIEQPQMKEELFPMVDAMIGSIIEGFIDEANPLKSATDVMNKTVKNTETGKDIKVSSALKYKDSQNKGQIQAYKAAVGLLKKAGVSDKELGIEKPKQVKGAGLGFRKTGEKELEKPAQPKQKTSKTFGKQRIISGKDKTLEKVDTLKSKAFVQKQIPDDVTFNAKNKKNQVGPPPPQYKLPKELYASSKVPPRHLKALERMMNTKANNETAKWSYFSDLPGGAGQISAQAGELMTMISTTLDDKQAQALFDSLFAQEQAQIQANPKLKIEGTRIVTKSWIQAAMNNRKAIRNRLAKEYPNAQIIAGSWDTESEVEAMGLKDYKKNKGFSTDAYFKIKTKDGQEILDEVSLKKSTAVNFLNSGTGKLSEWDSNISDDINPLVYQKNQRKTLYDFGSKNIKNLKKYTAKDAEFQAIVKSKKIDLDGALEKLKSGKGSRDINKVVLSAIATAAKKGDKGALKYLQNVQDVHKAHQKAVISALGSNPKLKQGMLGAIREEFPLKAVGEGEESMAIGPNSLDRAVLQDIFETSDFEQIKQGLFAVTNEEPPYLAYQAGPKGKVIPIATIVAREDGVGYGGQIKFEMQLDRRFAKILEQSNKNVYG